MTQICILILPSQPCTVRFRMVTLEFSHLRNKQPRKVQVRWKTQGIVWEAFFCSYCNPKGCCISTLRRPSNAWVSWELDHSERNFSTACFGNMNFLSSLQLLHCIKGVYFSLTFVPGFVLTTAKFLRIFTDLRETHLFKKTRKCGQQLTIESFRFLFVQRNALESPGCSCSHKHHRRCRTCLPSAWQRLPERKRNKITPLKLNMELKNAGLEDDVPFQTGDLQVPC